MDADSEDEQEDDSPDVEPGELSIANIGLPQAPDDSATQRKPPQDLPCGPEAVNPATTDVSLAGTIWDTAAVESAVGGQVRTCAEFLSSERPKVRLHAAAAILAVAQAFLGGLSEARDDPAAVSRDAVRAAALKALGQLASRSEEARQLAQMSETSRQLTERYAKRHPGTVEAFFSPVWKRQIDAVRHMRAWPDPIGEAEALVALALRHSSADVRSRALAMTVSPRDNMPPHYRSDAIVEALCDMLLDPGPPQTPQRGPWRGRVTEEGEAVDRDTVLKAIRQIRNKRAAPALLMVLMGQVRWTGNVPEDVAIAESLAATGEMRVVPTLCECLRATGRLAPSPESDGDQTWDSGEHDVMFYALLLMTHQSQEGYRLIVQKNPENGATLNVSFADPAQRKAACERLHRWWKENKDKPPYKGLHPIAVPIRSPVNCSVPDSENNP